MDWLNPSSELYHYGIKNMKWGLQRFQLGDGTWTPEGLARRRAREGYGDDELTSNKRYTKEEIVNSGNVKLVSKYRSELTTEELRQAVNRIDTERKLNSLLTDANKSKWTKRAEALVRSLPAIGKAADDLVTWATKGNGKDLLNYLSGKTERDALVMQKIKQGDYEWLDMNFDNLSLNQQKEAVNALGNRDKFKKKKWFTDKEKQQAYGAEGSVS